MDARLDGVLGVYVRDLSTGATVELRPDEVFPTASSIKLAVLYELYRQAEEGRIDLGGGDRGLPSPAWAAAASCRSSATASASPGATSPS